MRCSRNGESASALGRVSQCKPIAAVYVVSPQPVPVRGLAPPQVHGSERVVAEYREVSAGLFL